MLHIEDAALYIMLWYTPTAFIILIRKADIYYINYPGNGRP